MAHRQKFREGHTTRTTTITNDAIRFSPSNPLHCVREYDLSLEQDMQRIVDETVTFLRHFSQRLQRFRAQVGEFASVDDQPLRTSRHETQAACSSKVTTTPVNDVELDTPLSVDNKLPAGEDLIKLQEYSS